MNITIGELIGNFILVAGSFLLLIVLIKKFAWGNITSIFEERAKKISDDIDSAESARKNAEVLEQKREEALAGSREEAATIVETAKETAEKNKASILADTTEEVSRLKQKANQEIALLKEESREQIKKFQKDAIETAIKNAEILKTKYKTEGEAIASPIFKEAEQKVLAIKDVKEDKLESVIELIVERIVNSNGNS